MFTSWEKICTTEIIAHSELIINTYSNLLCEELLPLTDSSEENAYNLYHFKSVILSHDGTANPLFTYANASAQKLWEIDWNEFIGLPSKYSAEEDRREERQKLLDGAAKNGYIKNYNGIRISKSKKRFSIEDAILWNLTKGKLKVGQAVVFDKWAFL
jgi:hypothetical protein